MRFRKSVKICPGVRVNFSKSGVSTSVGGRGGSITVGKKGTYVNYGIPGTGIYNREKISRSAAKGNSNSFNIAQDRLNENMIDEFDINIVYAEDGSISFFQNDIQIEDKKIIRQIKNSNEFKYKLQELNEERTNQYNKITEGYTDIQRSSCLVYSNIEDLYNSIKQDVYEPKSFSEILPTDDELKKKAQKSIKRKLFGNKKRIEEYIVNYKKDYIDRKSKFLKEEQEREIHFNKMYEDEYNEKKKNIKIFGEEGVEETSARIDEWLRSITFPFEFNVEYEVKEDVIFIDLDLPEIEDIPLMTTQKMSSGVIKIKEKSKKQIYQDYSDCVYGLSIYFASNFFNIALAYNDIVLSAYTQRRDSSGRIKDEYILSVKFDRLGFSNLDYNVNAKENCMKFPNACLQNMNLSFKEIKPFN